MTVYFNTVLRVNAKRCIAGGERGKDYESQVFGCRRKYSLPPSNLPTFTYYMVRPESYSKYMATNSSNCSAVTYFPTIGLPWLLYHLSEVAFWIKAHGAAWKRSWEEG